MKPFCSIFLSTLICCSNLFGVEKLVIKGSDTLGAKMIPQIAEAFKAQHPEVAFEIAAEGSSTGLAAIIDQTADIGMSSRRAKSNEITSARAKGVILRPTMICNDGMAVIVNESLPIDALSLRQVERIFTGDIENWAAVAPVSAKISLYTRNTASGTYQDFKAYAMKRRDYALSSQKMAGNEQIAAEVASNPYGIGYVGLAYTQTKGVKVLAIDGVKPSIETVKSKQYPLSRPNFLYTNNLPHGLTAEFIDFVLSEEGQSIVSRVGFVPLVPEERATSISE